MCRGWISRRERENIADVSRIALLRKARRHLMCLVNDLLLGRQHSIDISSLEESGEQEDIVDVSQMAQRARGHLGCLENDCPSERPLHTSSEYRSLRK